MIKLISEEQKRFWLYVAKGKGFEKLFISPNFAIDLGFVDNHLRSISAKDKHCTP